VAILAHAQERASSSKHHSARWAGVLLLFTLASCKAREEVTRTACEGGDIRACDTLSAMYLLGKDVPKDEAKAAELSQRAMVLRSKACVEGDKEACSRLGMQMASVPLDVPRVGGGEPVQVVMRVELYGDGRMLADGKPIADLEALKAMAQKHRSENSDLRVVIAAEPNVQHGRVISALDALKLAGISKIAFGVQGAPAASAQP
jgi:biopolymer transport protein ExbD